MSSQQTEGGKVTNLETKVWAGKKPSEVPVLLSFSWARTASKVFQWDFYFPTICTKDFWRATRQIAQKQEQKVESITRASHFDSPTSSFLRRLDSNFGTERRKNWFFASKITHAALHCRLEKTADPLENRENGVVLVKYLPWQRSNGCDITSIAVRFWSWQVTSLTWLSEVPCSIVQRANFGTFLS